MSKKSELFLEKIFNDIVYFIIRSPVMTRNRQDKGWTIIFPKKD
jgi:hypothetical protein